MNPAMFTLDISGPLVTLTLNRGAQRNALLPQTLEEIIGACQHIQSTNSVSVLLLRGAGPSFSVGFDLKNMAALLAGGIPDRGALESAAQLGQDAVAALQNLNVITLGAAHGHAIGGGFLLLAACDIRVAATDTVFSIPEVDLGLPLTWGGVPLLMRELGPSLARELIVSCRNFGTDLLLPNGFLCRRYAPENFDESVAEFAAELAQKPAWALKASKQQFSTAFSNNAGETDTALFANAVLHPDFLPNAMRYLASIRSK